jgi:hypothetical protein
MKMAGSLAKNPHILLEMSINIKFHIDIRGSHINIGGIHIGHIDKGKAIPLHAMEALGGRGGIAPTHSRPRH